MNANTPRALLAVLLVFSLGGAFTAAAETIVTPISPPEQEPMLPKPGNWCGTGALQLLSTDGPAIRNFPLKHTKVDATVSGTVSRVHVTQVFSNPYTETIEAVYKFPLPHEAAVTDLHMKLGERVIRGVIDRREAARRIYEQARQSGHVATLLEQERPNIFTQSVANILPGSDIDITITYIESLDSEKGTWEFAFPMVVGPRFIPAGSNPSDVVPVKFGPEPLPTKSNERINPPFLPPSVRSGHDIELTLTLDAGVAIDNLRSPTHVFRRSNGKHGSVRVALHPADTVPNKDFVVRWDIGGDEPETAVLTHHDGSNGYVSVIVHPKQDLLENEVTAKEMVFVLDCSGSMSGEPMAAAKALARRALLDMGPDDSFQIIRFSNNASGFSSTPVAATPANVQRGLAYLNGLSGSGGTQMIEGIKASLGYPADPKRLRIVMFLTDGYIGNENQILAAVRDQVGDARLFSFGVGSSVNRFLLEEMAREGRGEVQYQLPGSNIEEEVTKFYARFRHPYLTDIELAWWGVDVVDAHPARIPDLFEGRSLTVRGRYERGGKAELRIRGKIAGRQWERRVQVDLPTHESGNPAIGSLWARRRIADLERSMRHAENSSTVEAITNLGLEHRLVTRWTSFVAVEERLVVSDGQPRMVNVPVDMPQGVSYGDVFNEAEQGSAARCVRAPALPTQVKAGLPVQRGRLIGVNGSIGHLEEDSASLRADVSADQAAVPKLDEKKNEPTVPGHNVAISMTAASGTASLKDTVTLRVVFTNHGSIALDIPAADSGWQEYGLRVIGSNWQELNSIEAASGEPRHTIKLAPGALLIREIEIPLSSLNHITAGASIHFILDGHRWGSTDRPRVEIKIRVV